MGFNLGSLVRPLEKELVPVIERTLGKAAPEELRIKGPVLLRQAMTPIEREALGAGTTPRPELPSAPAPTPTPTPAPAPARELPPMSAPSPEGPTTPLPSMEPASIPELPKMAEEAPTMGAIRETPNLATLIENDKDSVQGLTALFDYHSDSDPVELAKARYGLPSLKFSDISQARDYFSNRAVEALRPKADENNLVTVYQIKQERGVIGSGRPLSFTLDKGAALRAAMENRASFIEGKVDLRDIAAFTGTIPGEQGNEIITKPFTTLYNMKEFNAPTTTVVEKGNKINLVPVQKTEWGFPKEGSGPLTFDQMIAYEGSNAVTRSKYRTEAQMRQEMEDVQRNLDGKTFVDGANWLLENVDKTGELSTFYHKLLSSISGRLRELEISTGYKGSIRSIYQSAGPKTTAYYNVVDRNALDTGHSIVLGDTTDFFTATHELIHAITYHLFNKSGAVVEHLPKWRKRAVSDMKALYSFTQKELIRHKALAAQGNEESLAIMQAFNQRSARTYPLSTVDEFVTYGLTDPLFQKLLSKIKYSGKKTVWTTLVTAMNNLLGRPTSDTVLSQFLSVSENLIKPDSAGSGFQDSLFNLAATRLATAAEYFQGKSGSNLPKDPLTLVATPQIEMLRKFYQNKPNIERLKAVSTIAAEWLAKRKKPLESEIDNIIAPWQEPIEVRGGTKVKMKTPTSFTGKDHAALLSEAADLIGKFTDDTPQLKQLESLVEQYRVLSNESHNTPGVPAAVSDYSERFSATMHQLFPEPNERASAFGLLSACVEYTNSPADAIALFKHVYINNWTLGEPMRPYNLRPTGAFEALKKQGFSTKVLNAELGRKVVTASSPTFFQNVSSSGGF